MSADREGAHQLRPGLTLQDALANLSYERVPVKKTAEAGKKRKEAEWVSDRK